MQSNQEIQKQWQAFINSSEGSNVVPDDYNGGIFAEYIREHNDGIVSYSFLCQAVLDPSVLNRLHLKTGRWTADQISQKAAEEKAANEAARINQIAADWVKNECPLGLLEGTDLYSENSDRIVAYIKRHGGQVSAETFNQAVRALMKTNSLVWLSDETEIRNQPPAPPRKLSHQAQIEAGLIPDDSISKLRSHINDSAIIDPNKRMKEIIKKVIGPSNPWQQRADALVITDRRGRIDQGKTSQLRQVFVERNGKTDWELTYKKRNEICDGANRLRNRD